MSSAFSILVRKTLSGRVDAIHLDQMVRDLETFDGRFIVKVNPLGASLFPLKRGVDPKTLTCWLQRDARFYLVDAQSVTFDLVSEQRVEQLIFSSPTPLSSFMSQKEVVEATIRVLEEGQRMGVWGVFGTDQYNPEIMSGRFDMWLDFFQQKRNLLMVSFMRRAIDLIAKKDEKRSRLAA